MEAPPLPEPDIGYEAARDDRDMRDAVEGMVAMKGAIVPSSTPMLDKLKKNPAEAGKLQQGGQG